MAAILKVKDASGNWIDIPALKGDSGDGGGSTILSETDDVSGTTFTDTVSTIY